MLRDELQSTPTAGMLVLRGFVLRFWSGVWVGNLLPGLVCSIFLVTSAVAMPAGTLAPGFGLFRASALGQCSIMQGTDTVPSSPAYEICASGDAPPVLSHPDLQRLHASLAPGESRDVTDRFLRTDEPWPYTDVRGPGANTNPDLPDPFRAAYLTKPDDPAFDGPLLFIAPAQIEHSLGAAGAGETPPDVWTVTAGPYAPTVYGRVRIRGGKLADFVAHPTRPGTEIFGAAERLELSRIIRRHFGGT